MDLPVFLALLVQEEGTKLVRVRRGHLEILVDQEATALQADQEHLVSQDAEVEVFEALQVGLVRVENLALPEGKEHLLHPVDLVRWVHQVQEAIEVS